MFICIHTHGDFQERRPAAADWLHDDFLRLDTLFCVQLIITYSTVGTAKCVCIFLTHVFWPDGDVLKRSKHVTASNTHTLSFIDCCLREY